MEAPLLLPVVSTAGPSSISVEEATSSPPDDGSSAPPTTRSIALRVAAVLVVACASLFARHEASKGFAIDVVANGGPRDTAAGRRFHLFFASNGRAERILHRASRGVERALFPDASFPRKRVARVTVRVAGRNLTAGAAVVAAGAAGRGGEYVISLSPGLVSGATDEAAAVAAAVRRAVARMWLWDGRGAAPARVTEALVVYLASSGGGDEPVTSPPAQDDDDAADCMSPRFLRRLEQRRSGFVARLNRAMRDRWSDAAVDAALGAPVRPLCAAYHPTSIEEALPDSTWDGTRGASVAV